MKEYRVTVNYRIPETDTVQVFAKDEEEAETLACEQFDHDDAEAVRVVLVVLAAREF